MHWTPEHAQPLNQWPEQHLDVSSTTPSPAHKLELPPGGRQRCHYAWAHDDISALTASNLLKRYAEKYSGVLDSPYERPALGSYGDAAFLNGAKGDTDPWPGPEPPYPLASLHEGLPGTKSGGGSGSTGLGGSPVLAGNLPEPLYAGNAKYSGGVPLKVLGAPVYGPQLEPFEKFPERAPVPGPRGSFAVPSGEPSKGVDAGALELVTSKLVDCGPPVQWADVAGQGALKAALEEELLCQQAAAGAGLPGLQRPLSYKDLEVALAKVGSRGSPKELDSFVEWDKMYGSGH
ncbi:Putative fidgetin-like protein 2 [Fukomys damarensis]|uniref:Putative fidgetin-like protein 2 n=1 Tax=Fukomys damarensis TaxID=885580 RepID=A0A091DH11_FUKDA|nr:Putative fidgetin-like protein 2 [Fukomys damarensis]